jgi:PAS domain S-box-containing protein
VTIIDVTERKRSEQARRASEERFTTIFHSAPVAIGYGTVDGQILDANQQLCEFFERRRDELIGHTVQELGLWADPRERTRVIRKLREEGVVRNYEAKFQRKSGEERTGLLSMEIISLPGESVLLAMIVDVTERKALEAQLQRANRVESLGRLASGIAHDMNNILAPIMMSGPLLRMQLPPDEIERTLTTIEASARRGADLVRQLLMFGRGVEGERGPVRAADVIREVAQMAAQTFPRNIVIHVRIAPVVWPVRGDASQLHQILLNLCVNARDAMPLGGTLTVSADNLQVDENFAAMHSEAHAGPFVRLSVSDTGTGIAPEIVDRIFDPFFTTKEVGKGTGLGLSTVLGIVKSHGGFITLHSEVGQGSTFDVHLPALPTANEDYSVVASEPVPRGQNELILVVDDEENIRTVLCETLVRHGYRVLAASDGAEATAMFARSVERIGLVITDLDMPFMDGVALIKVLKRMKPDVKAMVSTGLGSADSTSHRLPELQALGITTVLTKPYTAERILKAVHSSLASG